MLSVFLLGFGSAMAATSAIDNLPGGAGVAYWQTSPGGFYTLLNVQNVADTSDALGIDSAAVAIHVTFYDKDSNHMQDFTVPLSPRDNFGCAVTGNGTTVTITPQSPIFPFLGYTQPAAWTFTLPGSGPANLQYGYVTVAVTRVDEPNFLGLPAGQCDSLYLINPPEDDWFYYCGNGDGNPMNDLDMANRRVVLPDVLFMRGAILGPNQAFAYNGTMLQGFLNIPAFSERADPWAPAGVDPDDLLFVDTLSTDDNCDGAGEDVDWNGDNIIPLYGSDYVQLTDHNGVDIHTPELYITNNIDTVGSDESGKIVADGCLRSGRYKALGSANNIYWARYNVNPTGVPSTDTTLLMIAPANSGTQYNPAAAIADGRFFTVVAYDDNEANVSTDINPPEVSLSPLISPSNLPLPGNFSIDHSTYNSGELRIEARAPMYGYTSTIVNGLEADLFPLVRNRLNINIVNLGADDDASGGVSNVRVIGY
jgi:hypothetical protein